MDQVTIKFCKWLDDNGSTHPKIAWPRAIDDDGCRGGIATETIESNEIMLSIPIELMMTPENALDDPVVGHIFIKYKTLLQGDVLLALYIMYETNKGSSSFYYPYIQTLPQPDTITDWKVESKSNGEECRQKDVDELLKMFEDDSILLKVKQRQQFLQRVYARFIRHICEAHPEHFPVEKFNFELFLFAWNSIQARAFGKRLPFTAMVPFADSLNHRNVQTKYDYNVDGNGLFRMFPSGKNRYPKGTEVFNSYGRRPNLNLMMDFGFGLLYNEWDCVDILCSLTNTLGAYATEEAKALLQMKITFLNNTSNRYSANTKVFHLYNNTLPFKLLSFLRLAHCSQQEFEEISRLQLESEKNKGSDMSDHLKSYQCALLSRAHEVAVLDHCIHICTRILHSADRMDAGSSVTTELLSAVDSSCVLQFTTSMAFDIEQLSHVNAAIRSHTQQQHEAEFDIDNPYIHASLNSLFQFKWIYIYRITKKNILINTVKKLNVVRNALQHESVLEGHKESNANVQLVSLTMALNQIPLYPGYANAHEETETDAPTENSTSTLGANTKTDQFHIVDYESIEQNEILLNDYLYRCLKLN